jgi:hypothetical protein
MSRLTGEDLYRLQKLLEASEDVQDEVAQAVFNAGIGVIFKGGYVEEYMKEKGWKRITEDWLARIHRNGKGCSWMHKCAHRSHHSLAKGTDAGRVRCKECGHMLDEAPQMLMELQKLKGSVG